MLHSCTKDLQQNYAASEPRERQVSSSGAAQYTMYKSSSAGFITPRASMLAASQIV